jgi:hypothetical protein
MLAHAAFAALMTGLSLDTPSWTALLADSDTEDPCIAFSHALYGLSSLHNREENALIVQRFLDSPPEALLAILGPRPPAADSPQGGCGTWNRGGVPRTTAAMAAF